MRLLGIDPGTHCGYAVIDGAHITSGVWDLSTRRHEGGGMRFLRLQVYLTEILKTGIDAVAYEEVHYHVGTDAAHVYGGIVAMISATLEGHAPPVSYQGINVKTIKKFATGTGNGKKAHMLAAAKRLWPLENIVNDNEADARFIALLFARNLGLTAPFVGPLSALLTVQSDPTKRAATPGASKRKKDPLDSPLPSHLESAGTAHNPMEDL